MIKNRLYRNGLLVILFIINGLQMMQAQTAIGKRAVANEFVILDFKANENRGIILPWVQSENRVDTPVGGTLIFDSTDYKVKYFKTGIGWEDLSIEPGSIGEYNDLVDEQQALIETNNKAILGDQTSVVSGVLVLESSNQVMVLPHSVKPAETIQSPVAGTMVYDVVSNRLCIFNGEKWSFWSVN